MSKLNFSIALGLASQNFKNGLTQAQNQLKGFASSVKSAMGMIAGAFAAGQIKAFSKECLDAYSAQMAAEQKLSVIMKQRMGVTDAEVKSIFKLASAQQQLGVIGDEVQLAGAQQVATFLTQKDSLNQLIPAMNNLLAQQKGLSASQGDAVNIGNLMGKVMQGQTSALKRVGISFDEAQEKILKYGTESEKAATLAQVIKDNVGDMNAELAKTDMGKIQQMNNTLGDLKEQIGGAIAPIVGQLAPSLTNIAVSMANGLTTAIETIKQNLVTVGEFIVAIFTAIKLTPIFQAWVTQAAAAEEQALARARAATMRREALEDELAKKKNALAVLEVKQTEVTSSQKLAIEQKIATQREAIKKTEVALDKAKDVERNASSAAAAAANTTIWSASWASIKAAGVLCWTTIKAAMVSTGIGALIMVVMFGLQKLVEWFSKLEMVQYVWGKVCEGCRDAWNWGVKLLKKFDDWYDSLGNIGKAVLAMVAPFTAVYGIIKKIINALGEQIKKEKEAGKVQRRTVARKHYYKSKDGKVFDNRDDALKHNKEIDKGTGDGGGKPTKTTTTTQTESDYEKWLKDYTQEIAKADASLKLQNTSQEEYEKKRLEQIKTAQEDLELMKPKNDAEAKLIEAKKKTLAGERKYYEQLTNNVEITAKPLDKVALGKAGKNKYDSTFDYKKTGDEILKAKLQVDIDNAKEVRDELKKQADAGCTAALEQLAKAEKDITSVEDKMRLAEARKDIEEARKALSTLSSVNNGISVWKDFEGGINNIGSAIEKLNSPDTSGWEKFCTVIDTLIGLFQTYQAIATVVNAITEASSLLKGAEAVETALVAKNKGAEAIAEDNIAVAAPSATAAITTESAAMTASVAPAIAAAKALEKLAAAQMFAANASIPVVGAGIAAGGVATMETTLKSLTALQAFANGGFIQGAYSTGDRVLVRANKGEAILNPMQQRNFMRLANGKGNDNNAGGTVRFRIVGRDLVGVMNNENSKNSKIN